ncbi:nuclear transport factor 2 family protein [Streptosporangium amethystogenes]|uniref:nuclear transport factor 2 family protein n=1 Tax=Streptosporangium amethystogenes TaxID=2002 RepID=UPI0004C8FDEB|nr:nuclear transport factor 2 family protein [Streptosporangium amethystogenes]
MDLDEAQRFAEEWAADWNSHDLDRITGRYSDDVVFRSPLAARIIEGSEGVVRGIEALRAYWAEGLRRNPDLRFEVIGVCCGIDTVVINYQNQTGQLSAEVLIFRDGLVVSGMGTHGPRPI